MYEENAYGLDAISILISAYLEVRALSNVAWFLLVCLLMYMKECI